MLIRESGIPQHAGEWFMQDAGWLSSLAGISTCELNICQINIYGCGSVKCNCINEKNRLDV